MLMDVRQLRYFSVIAEEKQITKAAKKLHMAQPPLSQQLKLLEEELGVKLIDRNGRSLELTQAGEVLYQKAKDLLIYLEETKKEVKEIGNGLKGNLAIGSVKTSFSLIPERISYFRKYYPLVSFTIKEGDTFTLAEELKNRTIELAIVRLPFNLDLFSHLPLQSDCFVAVIPDHWHYEHGISMEEAARLPLIMLSTMKGAGLYSLVMNEFKKKGLIPEVVCRTPDAAMVLSLVRAGVGAALLPQSALTALPLTGVKAVPISDADIYTETVIIWLKDRYLSKNARHFLHTFTEEDVILPRSL